jgi:hypothetical protein
MKDKMRKIPSYGWHIPFQEFLDDVESACLIDYDGYGMWATETEMLNDHNQKVWPSDFIENKKPKEGFTHVVWFNR